MENGRTSVLFARIEGNKEEAMTDENKLTSDTESASMKDFDATGWKILPYPSIGYIPDEIHQKLLDESLKKYRDIWEALK